MEEVWKDIPGYEGMYQVSNMGRVKSLPRVVDRGKWGKRLVNERPKTPTLGKDGYYRVWLHKDGRGKDWLLHRLVAYVFLPAPSEEQTHVRHLDGNKSNCSASNLAYGTPTENMADQLSYMRPGDNPRNWKLTREDVIAIRKRIAAGEPNLHICKDYGVSDVVISNIKLGRTYTWLTSSAT